MEGPSSANAAQLQSSFLGQTTESCSVCLDAVKDVGERSITKLKCGHHFHLDCIGSAFNAKGSMQCPNCRCIEEGEWLYANGSRRLEDSSMDGIQRGDSALFAGIIDILQSNEDSHRRQVRSGSHSPSDSPPTYQYLTLVFERTNAPPSAYAEYVAHILYSQQRSLSNSFHTCPYLAAQGMSFVDYLGAPVGHAELSPPLQNRRHDGNSAIMQTVHLSERGTQSSRGAGNLYSRSVANVDSAASTVLPNETTRRSSRPAGSGNHVAASHDGLSMQFGQTGANQRSAPPLSRGTGTPCHHNVHNQGQRVNQAETLNRHSSHQGSRDNSRRSRQPEWPSDLYLEHNRSPRGQTPNTHPSREGSRDNSRRSRRPEWPSDLYPEHNRSSRGQTSNTRPSHQGTRDNSRRSRHPEWPSDLYPEQNRSPRGQPRRTMREDSEPSSGSSLEWQLNVQVHPPVHRRAYNVERYLNSSHHISNSQSAEGMASDRWFHRGLYGSHGSEQAQVESWSPFGHHEMNPFLGFPPASMQDGSNELMSPHNNFVGPQT